MKKVIILHGYTGSPDSNWFPWLKKELVSKGVETVVPQMPNPDMPKLDEWLSQLDKMNLGKPSELYMVGHSLGCATILRYLETVDSNEKLAGAVLVAGFAEPIGIPEIDNFLTPLWNDDKIKSSVNELIDYFSDNDPFVPIKAGRHLRDRFNAKLVEVRDAGHFNWRDGFIELPIVFNKLQELIAF